MSVVPRTTRAARAARAAGLVGRSAFARAAHRAGSIGASDERRQQRLREFHAQQAERYAATLGQMKGALMKAGQLLSFVESSMIPAAYREIYHRALSRLQDDAPPMDGDLVDVVLAAELGTGWTESFTSFDEAPVAAASIGQVHRATLRDGTDVAVKVQYPGVGAAIEADLQNTELLAAFFRMGQALMGARAPRLDTRATVAEIRERISEELDYRLEASHQQRFVRLYDGHPFIRIPRVVDELSTSRVLTMEYARGASWRDAVGAPDELRQLWAETIYRFVFRSLDRFYVFNADPHPGNYIFHDDGSVSFLDFGCVRAYEPGRVRDNIELIKAVANRDAVTLRRLLVDNEYIAADDPGDGAEFLEFFGILGQPLAGGRFRFTTEWVESVVSRIFDLRGPYGHIARRLSMPRENVFLTRIDLGLYSILGALGAENAWRGIVEEMWDGAPGSTGLGRSEDEWLAARAPSQAST